jgi:hypothetical protein
VNTIPGNHEGNYRKRPYWALYICFVECWCKSTLEPTQELVIWAP